jgi:hypothetical protein
VADDEDLDETRRLAYMALVDVDRKDRNLAGTLVNALVHHQKAASQDEAVTHVENALNEQDEVAIAWLRDHIRRITAELEE